MKFTCLSRGQLPHILVLRGVADPDPLVRDTDPAHITILYESFFFRYEIHLPIES
jgi:hypothetical protein